jgi:hypothetical protein
VSATNHFASEEMARNSSQTSCLPWNLEQDHVRTLPGKIVGGLAISSLIDRPPQLGSSSARYAIIPFRLLGFEAMT